MHSHTTNLACAFFLAVVPFGSVLAGPLLPPLGPVVSTMKPLSEIEPRIAVNATNTPGTNSCLYRITQPGSYYLTSNLNVYSLIGISGIEIASSNVTLDLNGFTIQGSGITIDGIRTAGGANDNIVIRNGSLIGFGQKGVNLLNGGVGRGAKIENVTVKGNGSDGMLVCPAAAVSRCVAIQNGRYGIYTSSGTVITSCSAISNASSGFATGRGVSITHCSATDNGEHGFSTLEGATVAECSASDNAGAGISVYRGATVTACNAYSNEQGGIEADNWATISNCNAYSNTRFGISALSNCAVQSCSTGQNDGDGIVVGAACTVRDNLSTHNGAMNNNGAAIHAEFGGNRIEGNNCLTSTRGIEVGQTGNIILRNTCGGNDTNWSIVAGNSVAPIVVGGSNAAAISGNSYAGSLGSTDPNANFTK